MYFVLSKKFSDSYWNLLRWIAYVSLLATSLWFTWGVKEKFAQQETAIRLYEDNIDAHPTISLCNTLMEYEKDFNITYTTYQNDGFSVDDEVVLIKGENDLRSSGENVKQIC